MAPIHGTNGDDTLSGTSGDDTIIAKQGDDVVDAGAGDDLVMAGAGDDIVYGGDGDDVLKGGSGNDALEGGAGDDNIDGNAGEDIVSYSGSLLDYFLEVDGPVATITDLNLADGDEGTDTLKSVEAIEFNDFLLWLDGRNNNPFLSGDIAAEIVEIDDGQPGENSTTLAASGVLTLIEFDLDDSHQLSVSELGVGYLGVFSALISDPATGDGVGAIDWSYAVEDSELDFLSAGQMITQTYDVSVDDGQGGVAVEMVTITLIGTNDAPVIGVGGVVGGVTEIADGAPGENETLLSAAGVIAFSDVDLADQHIASATLVSATDSLNGAIAGLGALSVTINDVATGDGAGLVSWSFEVEDSELDFLAAGQTITQTYDVSIDDGQGDVAVETVTITLNGTNDAPMILAVEPPSFNVTRLSEPSSDKTDRYGSAVAISGDQMIVGEQLNESSTGSVYIYQVNAQTGVATELARFDGAAPGDRFGANADIDGEYAIVGAFKADGGAGAAYIYRNGVDGWELDTPFVSPKETAADAFGFDVAIQGGRAVIGGGGLGVNLGVGKVYVYDLQPDLTWSGPTEIAPLNSNGLTFNFGDAVELDGDRIIVGASSSRDNGPSAGSAFIFERNAQGAWIEINQLLPASGPAAPNNYGSAVAIEGDLAVVGAHAGSSGSVFIYEYIETVGWTQTTELVGEKSGDQFGVSVEIEQGRILVGANGAQGPGDPEGDAGFAYLYEQDASGEWILVEKFEPFDGNQDDNYGARIGMDGDLIAIGAPHDDRVVDNGPGAVYIYPNPPENSGRSGVIRELEDGAPGENATLHTAAGALDFVDADLADGHVAVATLLSAIHSLDGAVAERGAMSASILDPSTSDGVGVVGWSFQVEDSALDDLAAGETITQTYEVTVDDQNGGLSTELVTITLVGRDDAPTGPLIVGDTAAGSLSIGGGVNAVGDVQVALAAINGDAVSALDGIVGNQFGSNGAVIVSGVGSLLSIEVGNLSVGQEGTGSLLVEAGGEVIVDSGTEDVNVAGDSLDLIVGGSPTGVGDLVISGAGSRVETRGVDNIVRIGFNGGVGSLLVEDGGTFETLFFEIARNAGSTGMATVTGAGSTVIVSNEGGLFSEPYSYEAGFVRVGRGVDAYAELHILDGARFEVREGATVNNDTTGPAMALGRDGGSGTVIVDGAGSILSLTQASPFDGFFGPFLEIGRGNSAGVEGPVGSSLMKVSNGGAVELLGEFGQVLVGARGGGVGELNILSGSTLDVHDDSGNATFYVGVESGAAGVVNVSGEGSVLAASGLRELEVGRGPNTVGEVTVDGIGASLKVSGPVGGFSLTQIGKEGDGNLIVSGGARAEFHDHNVDLGTQLGGDGDLTVSGAGSLLTIERGNLGVGTNGLGSLRVEAGGEVIVDSGSQDTGQFGDNFDFLVGASLGGMGDVVVTGIGSRVETRGVDNVVRVGFNGGVGSLLVEDQGTIDTLYFEVGRNADSVGVATVRGAGSTIIVSPEHGLFSEPYAYESGFSRIGNGGHGVLNILEGGKFIVQEGETNNTDTYWPIMHIGQHGGVGVVNVDGDATELRLDQSAVAPEFFGPSIWIGSGAAGDGTLNVSGNALVNLNGAYATLIAGLGESGVALVDVSDGASIKIAGEFSTLLAGSNVDAEGQISIRDGGEVLVDGLSGPSGLFIAGGEGSIGTISVTGRSPADGRSSKLTVRSEDGAKGYSGIGEFGYGELNISGGGLAEFINSDVDVSTTDSGTGALIVRGDGSTLLLDNSFLTIGSSGYGSMTIEDGGVVNQTSGGFQIGWAGGATGTVTVRGDDSVMNISNFFSIGAGNVDGIGAGQETLGYLDVLDGGAVNAGDDVQVGGNVDGVGYVRVDGAGDLQASTIDADGHNILVGAILGTGALEVSNGGVVVAQNILIGAQGALSGDGGIIDANVQILGGGLLSPGNSVGELSIDGNLSLNGATAEIEIDTPFHHDVVAVSNGIASLSDSLLHFSFVGADGPNAGDAFQFILGASLGDLSNISIAVTGLADGFEVDPLSIDATGVTLTASNDGFLDASTTLLFGSNRADVFDGGDGDDVLRGGGGNDILTGSAGADRFVFEDGGGDDVVTDFSLLSPGDLIDVRGYQYASMADFQSVSQLGSAVLIEFDADDSVTLEGVSIASLSDADFVF